MPVRAPLILLVEDDAEDEHLTVEALGGSGIVHRIQVVRDGPAALEYLFGESDAGRRLPVLVLLDIKLPKLSGLEVLERIRSDRRTHRVPVVILTTSSSEEDLVRSYQLGANSFIRKPVDFPHFAEAIRQLGLYWFVVAEVPPTA